LIFACDETGLAAAEEARRQAMLGADTRALAAMCAETLVYVHSSGVIDSRESYLQKLDGGALRYETLEFVAPRLRDRNDRPGARRHACHRAARGRSACGGQQHAGSVDVRRRKVDAAGGASFAVVGDLRPC
jgi:hypothetical protein